MSVIIRPLVQFEIPLLKDFAPKEWNTDISELFGRLFKLSSFHPVIAEWNGHPAGCANGLCNGNAGWLGNIIVLPDYRGKGIGSALTDHLVSHLQQRGCLSLILVATPLGEPIYRKAGFVTHSTYIFLRRAEPAESGPVRNIRKAEAGDHKAIHAMDRKATGEARRPFLEQFLVDAWVHHAPGHRQIGGFFLPNFGNGLIIAGDAEAGLALLNFKVSRGSTFVVVPSGNQAALDLLTASGFEIHFTPPRMVLGPELDWHPEMVFSRGSGYCG